MLEGFGFFVFVFIYFCFTPSSNYFIQIEPINKLVDTDTERERDDG